MSETTTTPTVTKAPKAAKAKKPAKSAVNGKPVRTEAQTLALGLRFQQVRILKVLNKSPKSLTRSALAEKASVSSMTENLGPVNAEDIKRIEKVHGRPTLVGAGLVRCSINSINDKDIPEYEITASGRKALEILASDPCWPAGH